jgi:hypothetical protein
LCNTVETLEAEVSELPELSSSGEQALKTRATAITKAGFAKPVKT